MLTASFDTFLGTFRLALDFSAQARKTTVLLGESGAGKTTVLRLLAGLLDPERGRIALDGVTYFESERHQTFQKYACVCFLFIHTQMYWRQV